MLESVSNAAILTAVARKPNAAIETHDGQHFEMAAARQTDNWKADALVKTTISVT